MIPILVLWAVPRSTSTAFERTMSQRGDHECVHEPFGEVWYSRRQQRVRAPLRGNAPTPAEGLSEDVADRAGL